MKHFYAFPGKDVRKIIIMTKRYRTQILPVLFSLLLLTVQGAVAQKGKLDIAYTVALTDVASQQFHVTTDIKNIDQPQLDLALPTWAPGWYVVENYAKNVIKFRVTDASGKVLPLRMSRKQTWNIDTRGIKQIRVDYDYSATILGLNQAKIASDFAFFTGIELFLEPVGHKNDPSTLKFLLPQNWKLVSALKDTADPTVFYAADYDTLVDAPAMMGNFDITPYTAEGKPHYLVSVPAGAFNAEKSKRFTEMMAGVVKADAAMFGGLPYDKYISFYFFMPAQSNASGALEHLNSYVAFSPAGERSTPEGIIGTGAHEYFHLWNVKRIRPAEMWPYDYSRENETSLLWVSEGFTNYYGSMARYRAGLLTEEQFIGNVAGAAGGVETDEARNYISPANSSVITWVGYDTPQAFSISYYTQGQNLAALLDLSIRNDTDGAASLDDVMRALFNDHYKKGKGFTADDFIGIANRLTKKNYRDFFDKYVFGTDVPDYNKIFGYAGLTLEKKQQPQADFGFNIRPRNGGLAVNGVTPNGAADKAGIKVGDVITKIDGDAPFNAPFSTMAGKDIKLTVTRGGETMEMPMKVGSRSVEVYALTESAAATPQQLKIRQGWLKR